MVPSPMWRFLATLPTLAAALLLAGCAGIPRDLQAPEVSFVGLKSIEASVFEQRMQVRMLVRNPNGIDLPVNGLDVDLELAGEHFAHGVSAREFVVPAGGEAEFDMNVTANAVTALLKLAGGDYKSGVVDYRVKGRLSTRLGMLRTIPFDEKGSLPLAELLGKKAGLR